MDELSESNIGKVLDWAYSSAIKGLPGTDTAYELAESYLSKNSDVDSAINSLVNWQTTKCATSGFITGLGGVITLPVAVPANIASVIYVQMRMIASIAHLREYDLKDDQVRTFIYACLTGQSAAEFVKSAGAQIGMKVGQAQINRIPVKVLTKINQKVGFRLITKFGEKGVINLGKMIPLIGGVIGGSFDAISTRTIAAAAQKTSRSSNTLASTRVVCLLAIRESLCRHLEPQRIAKLKAALISTILSAREYYIFTNLVQRPSKNKYIKNTCKLKVIKWVVLLYHSYLIDFYI